MDSASDEIRYAKVLDLINTNNPDDTIFLSNHLLHSKLQDRRLESMKEIALTSGFRWVQFQDESIDDILLKVSQFNILNDGVMLTKKVHLTPENTRVIIGGTNTAGCLLFNSNVSATHWVDEGYKVDMCLSMCADYQSSGLNQADKNQMAFASLYNYIKKYNLIDKIDVYYSAPPKMRVR